MKTLLIISAIIGIQTVNAQSTKIGSVTRKGTIPQTAVTGPRSYDVSHLSGKWQEVKRTDLSSKRIRFTDSLQLNFNKRDSVIVRDGENMTMKGYAAVEGSNNLEIAGDVYTIVSLRGNKLVVNDGQYIRELHKRKRFYHETLGTVVIPKEDLSNPEVVNTKRLLGQWDIYRTQAVPGVAEDSAIIRQITLKDIVSDGTVDGVVVYTKAGVTESFPVKATFKKGYMTLSSVSQKWSFNTFKADGKEFVFGNHGGLVYFAKQL